MNLAWLAALAAFACAATLRYRSRLLAAEARVLEIERGRALEQSKLETLVHHLPDGIVMTNLRGEVLYVNAPAMSMLGIKPEEARAANKGLFELLRPARLRQSVQNILERHTRSEVVEIPVEGEGRRRYYHTTVTLFSAPGSEEFGVLLLMRDVTVERELAQMKEDFFHSVAHDLRAPLFAVQGYMRLLEKSVPKDERLQGYFDAIRQSCEKLELFIQDILDTHRLEAGQLQLQLSSIEPLAFLQRIKRLYDVVADEKGVKLELRLPEDYPGAVEADERLLERVFNNLVSNAFKFTPRGGSIRLSAARAGQGQVEFSVADTGSGIPREHRSRLFEKFQRTPEGEAHGGFGLGLHICRRIVDLHGGKIWVESEPGKGSEFVFRVPVRQRKA